jgi:hypothetical protein
MYKTQVNAHNINRLALFFSDNNELNVPGRLNLNSANRWKHAVCILWKPSFLAWETYGSGHENNVHIKTKHETA